MPDFQESVALLMLLCLLTC